MNFLLFRQIKRFALEAHKCMSIRSGSCGDGPHQYSLLFVVRRSLWTCNDLWFVYFIVARVEWHCSAHGSPYFIAKCQLNVYVSCSNSDIDFPLLRRSSFAVSGSNGELTHLERCISRQFWAIKCYDGLKRGLGSVKCSFMGIFDWTF